MFYRRNAEPGHDDHRYAITYTSMGDVFRVFWPEGISPYDTIIAFDLDCCQSFDLYNNLKGMRWKTIVRICKPFWIKDDYLQLLFNMLGSPTLDNYLYAVMALNKTIDKMLEIIPEEDDPVPQNYRRNADKDLRQLAREAEGQGPEEQARLLAALMRAGKILPEQVRVAACLRHPAALLLYPDDIGGNGDGERPRLTAEGMAVHCAGAAQLGDDIQSKIEHLPLKQMADILLTIVTQILDAIEITYSRVTTLDTPSWNIERPPCYNFAIEVRDLIEEAWEIIAGEFSNEDEAYYLMRQLRLRAAQIGNSWPEQNNISFEKRSLCSALDRALTVANVFFEIAVGDGDQYRAMLGVKAFLREVCRLDPDIIDTWAIADAVLEARMV